ncbi:MFS transporter [Macrococcoides canis]|nr:MFS transporter [Macrococcus canis]
MIIITQLGVIITLIGMMGSFFLEHKLLLFTLSYISFNICISLQRPAIDAILIDAVDETNKKQVYTISYWLGNISGILGIFIGGTFYQYKLTLFILSICVSILATLLLYKGLSNEDAVITYKNKNKGIKDLLNEYFQVLKDRRYSLLIIGNSFFILLELTL